jgi:hypothetical protein
LNLKRIVFVAEMQEYTFIFLYAEGVMKHQLLALFALLALSACGGGGGGGAATAAGSCNVAANCSLPTAISAVPPQK